MNAGEAKKVLQYEMEDMEQAIKTGDVHKLKISDTKDVMDIMTDLRKKWNMKYPGENGNKTQKTEPSFMQAVSH